MRTRIVKLGNSQGIRIPKTILEQSGLNGEVDLEVQGSRIIIKTPENARQGWEQAFREMAGCGDDALLDEDLTGRTPWDENEWRW
jgi:antitoxin MazE